MNASASLVVDYVIQSVLLALLELFQTQPEKNVYARLQIPFSTQSNLFVNSAHRTLITLLMIQNVYATKDMNNKEIFAPPFVS